MNNHKFDIRHFAYTYTNVSEHFNSHSHTIGDFSSMPIEWSNNGWTRLMKETIWMHKPDTVLPNDMNSKILI